MNYKLAKQLKDAGFPQELKSGTAIIDVDNDVFVIGDCLGDDLFDGGCGCCTEQVTYKDWVRCPTLSELIAACGDRFNGLIRKGSTVWLAAGGQHTGFYGDEFLPQGSTPEEAVAKLWFVLNQKTNG